MCQNLRWFAVWGPFCQMQFQAFVCNIKQNRVSGPEKMRIVFILSLNLTDAGQEMKFVSGYYGGGGSSHLPSGSNPWLWRCSQKASLPTALWGLEGLGKRTIPRAAAARGSGRVIHVLCPFLLTHPPPPCPPQLLSLLQLPTPIQAQWRFGIPIETILRTFTRKEAAEPSRKC